MTQVTQRYIKHKFTNACLLIVKRQVVNKRYLFVLYEITELQDVDGKAVSSAAGARPSRHQRDASPGKLMAASKPYRT